MWKSKPLSVESYSVQFQHQQRNSAACFRLLSSFPSPISLQRHSHISLKTCTYIQSAYSLTCFNLLLLIQEHTHRVVMFRWVCAYHHLEGLNEGPQQDADGVALSQQLDKTSGSEQPQKTQVDHLVLGEKAAAVRRGSYTHIQPFCRFSPTWCSRIRCSCRIIRVNFMLLWDFYLILQTWWPWLSKKLALN